MPVQSIDRSVKALVANVPPGEPVYLQITTQEPVVSKRNTSPVILKLPNKLHSIRDISICLIVKDPQQRVIDELEKRDCPTEDMFEKIISVKKLKAQLRSKKQNIDKFKKSTDLILADERVIHLLPDILGPQFYKGSNPPVPIKLGSGPSAKKDAIDATHIKYQVKAINHSTLLSLSPSTCISCLIGYSDMELNELVQNVEAIKLALLKQLDGSKPKLTINKMHIKTPESASLPIYSEQ